MTLTNICRHCQRVIQRVEYSDGSAFWMHVDGTPIANGGGYSHCRTGTTAGPANNTGEAYSPSKDLKAFGLTLTDSLIEGMRQGQGQVKRALNNPTISAPMCIDHVERQHRDMLPPWCNTCGWTHGREAIPVAKLGRSRIERDDHPSL